MSLYGADVAQLRDLAVAFDGAASRLDGGRAAVSNRIQLRLWVGPIAVRFRLNWESQYSRMLHAAAEELRQAARVLRDNADEQARASSQTGVSSGSSAVSREQVDVSRNARFFWEEGFAWPWDSRVGVQHDIPLGSSDFTLDNVDQEGIGDCAVLASLGVLGRSDPDYFLRHITQMKDGSYSVVLYDENGHPLTYVIDGDVLANGVRGANGKQSWMTIYEAALIRAGLLGEDGNYAPVPGKPGYIKNPVMVMQAVTGADGISVDRGDPDYPSFGEVQRLVREGRPVALGTVNSEVTDSVARSKGVEPLQLVEQHEYMVDKVNSDGTVTLVNPWGGGGYSADDGSHRITISQAQYDLYFDNAMVAADRSEWREDLYVSDFNVMA